MNNSEDVSKNTEFWGAWVAQSVKRLTSTQVMISQFMSLSPALGSVLTQPSVELKPMNSEIMT